MKKIYISGPISSHPTGNVELFDSVASKIRQGGDIPVNPHEVCSGVNKTAPWADFMREDIKALMDCDEILMLPGWSISRGARLENLIAMLMEMKVTYAQGVE
jgi:hypothetical protein